MTRWVGAGLVSVGVIFGGALAQAAAELPTPALAVVFAALGLIVLVSAVYDELEDYRVGLDRRFPGMEGIEVPEDVARCRIRTAPRPRPALYDAETER